MMRKAKLEVLCSRKQPESEESLGGKVGDFKELNFYITQIEKNDRQSDVPL